MDRQPYLRLAHVTADRQHPLADHLAEVARLASEFAGRFGAGEWGALAGRWHDLGKFAPSFQRLIRTENGLDASHIEGDEGARRDHSSAGAVLALDKLGSRAVAPILAIAGHHAGLPDWKAMKVRLERSRDRLEAVRRAGVPEELLDAGMVTLPPWASGRGTPEVYRRLEMWIRFIFSALCDADFLDTERFFEPDRAALRESELKPAELEVRLGEYLRRLAQEAPRTEVNRVRAEVLEACRGAARQAPGAFSLTVPTGGGKTLASLAFALRHAVIHGLDRVIVVIPYTSITEQTARAYRKALGDEVVLEHHSSLEPDEDTDRSRLAAENWDAPLVVTTTVQLFESLFAARPSACRKLHRLARSVIVLDEAQTLPPGLLTPILDGLRALTRDFGASVVFSTATQPAFRKSSDLDEGLEGIREIVPPGLRAFERLRRVRVRWPASREPVSWEQLAEEIAQEPRVLAIVHRRDDARHLCEAVDRLLGNTETFHLSALMCPAHRSQRLREIRERLEAGGDVRVVSTQLVEAGVDLDFPVVYRALGGLDSMAQAAGRCNREGRLGDVGQLRVFRAPTTPPKGVPSTALAVAESLLEARPELDLFVPETFEEYFSLLYGVANRDVHDIQGLREALDFEAVARAFRMIEDDWSAPLIVPYDEAEARLDALAATGPTRDALRGLQRYTVTVPKALRERWLAAGFVERVAKNVVALRGLYATAYDQRLGLVPGRVGGIRAPDLIVDG